MKISLFLLCFLAGIGGCSGKDEVDPYATVSEFCEGWGKAACTANVVSACSGAEKADADTTRACVESQRNFCEGLLPSKGYSSQHATQCLDAVHSAYSDGRLSAAEIAVVRHRGEPCNHLIRGSQAKGETCASDDDCDTLKNYLCITKSGEGTCQIPMVVENGTACSAPEAACHVGFFCDGDNCVQSKAVGGKCGADFECTTGLVCNVETAKCEARVSQTDCAKDDDCTTNVCAIPVGATTGRCVSTVILAPSEGVCEDLR